MSDPSVFASAFDKLSSLTAGSLCGFIAALLGWQINLLAIHVGLERGRTAAFLTGFGAVFGDLLYITAVLFGAGRFLDYPGIWLPAKILGVITFLWIGLVLLFKKPSKSFEETPPIKKRGRKRSFVLGFLSVAGNPGFLILWIGILSLIVTHFPFIPIFTTKLYYTGGFIAGGALWFLFLALIVLDHIKGWGEERLYKFSRLSALVILLAGCFLIFKKI